MKNIYTVISAIKTKIIRSTPATTVLVYVMSEKYW